jgi:hypothetical protein
VELFASFSSISMVSAVAQALQEEALPVIDPHLSRMTFLAIFSSKHLPKYFLTLVRLAHARPAD